MEEDEYPDYMMDMIPRRVNMRAIYGGDPVPDSKHWLAERQGQLRQTEVGPQRPRFIPKDKCSKRHCLLCRFFDSVPSGWMCQTCDQVFVETDADFMTRVIRHRFDRCDSLTRELAKRDFLDGVSDRIVSKRMLQSGAVEFNAALHAQRAINNRGNYR